MAAVDLRFLAKHMDTDLLQLATTSVPPADLSQVAVFRTCMSKYDHQARTQFEHTHMLTV